MTYASHHIAELLRGARERRGLSQRQLAAAAGVPQSHISKIENGAVDLRLSSLLALARTLALELALVPREVVPAVRSIVRRSEPAAGGKAARRAQRSLDRSQNAAAQPGINLPPDE